MNKISKKTIPTILLAALFLIVGGFCNGPIASAYTPVSNQEVVVAVEHPVDCSSENKQVEKAKPISNTLMPCCVERKNNSNTVVPAATQDRVNLSAVAMTEQVIVATDAVDQKIYPSSPSPPPEAENISSTVKLE